MNRKFLALFAGVLFATGAKPPQAGAQRGSQADVIADGTAINAKLGSDVNAKKIKEGDYVIAHTTEAVKSQGKTLLPKGTKLVGHVTRASARSKGDAESALGITFDKAVLKSGQEIPLNGRIQALAAPPTQSNCAVFDAPAIRSSSSVSSCIPSKEVQFTSNSHGVFWMSGVNLDGSVFTSSGKNVYLYSGSRMLLVTGAQASSAPEKATPKLDSRQPDKQ